jgi:hypothetical protein
MLHSSQRALQSFKSIKNQSSTARFHLYSRPEIRSSQFNTTDSKTKAESVKTFHLYFAQARETNYELIKNLSVIEHAVANVLLPFHNALILVVIAFCDLLVLRRHKLLSSFCFHVVHVYLQLFSVCSSLFFFFFVLCLSPLFTSLAL